VNVCRQSASSVNGANSVGGRLMARRLSSRPAIVCASSAPPVTGPVTTSVESTIDAGSTSSRSWANLQMVEG
jgi:hypothetical protein